MCVCVCLACASVRRFYYGNGYLILQHIIEQRQIEWSRCYLRCVADSFHTHTQTEIFFSVDVIHLCCTIIHIFARSTIVTLVYPFFQFKWLILLIFFPHVGCQNFRKLSKLQHGVNSERWVPQAPLENVPSNCLPHKPSSLTWSECAGETSKYRLNQSG